MGAWSESITGNDTAQDLRSEYQVAFYYYNDVDTALRKINDYVRNVGIDESDESEWCDYYYSLADFMWSKGILTDAVKNETVRLIDSGFGLEIWEDAGKKTLEKRKKVLKAFRDKIMSPQPPKKKISMGLHKKLFEIGDIIILQIQTADKTYTGRQKNVSEETLKKADGKYVAIRKIADIKNRLSAIEPAACNYYPIFQLYNKLFNMPPELENVINLDCAKFPLDGVRNSNHDGLFCGYGGMLYFKKRKYAVIGNYQKDIKTFSQKYRFDGQNPPCEIETFFFGINHEYYNVDEALLNGISCFDS